MTWLRIERYVGDGRSGAAHRPASRIDHEELGEQVDVRTRR